MNIFKAYLSVLAFDFVFATELDTRLKSATLNGDANSILSLVKEGANPNIMLDTNQTPLTKLCELEDIPSVVELIKLGADMDFPSVKHCPLAVAIRMEHVELVRQLVTLGCKSYHGDLTKLAIGLDQVDIVKFMIDWFKSDYASQMFLPCYLDIMFVFGFSKRHNPEIIDYVICKAPLPIEQKQRIYTQQLVKCPESYWEYLRKSGLVHGLADEKGRSFLMHTMGYWNDEIPVKLMRCESTDLEHTDHEGNGLIHYAKFGPVFDALIARGADVNMQNAAGRTPLMAAFINGDHRVAQMLVRRGADTTIADNTGSSPQASEKFQYWLTQFSRPDPLSITISF